MKYTIFWMKGCITMILMTILGIMLVMLLLFAILALGAGGGLFIVIFADLIVCALFIAWLMKRLANRKK